MAAIALSSFMVISTGNEEQSTVPAWDCKGLACASVHAPRWLQTYRRVLGVLRWMELVQLVADQDVITCTESELTHGVDIEKGSSDGAHVPC